MPKPNPHKPGTYPYHLSIIFVFPTLLSRHRYPLQFVNLTRDGEFDAARPDITIAQIRDKVAPKTSCKRLLDFSTQFSFATQRWRQEFSDFIDLTDLLAKN